MSDLPVNPTEPTDDFDHAFDEMEETLSDLPQGEFITIRHGANAPVYAPLDPQEQSITIRIAVDRCGLTLGASVQAYVDNNIVSLDTVVATGTVVTLVGE